MNEHHTHKAKDTAQSTHEETFTQVESKTMTIISNMNEHQSYERESKAVETERNRETITALHKPNT